MAQKGLFAFQGVDQAGELRIDDFAATLAAHPAVPAAWAQKLCYWVNSAACASRIRSSSGSSNTLPLPDDVLLALDHHVRAVPPS